MGAQKEQNTATHHHEAAGAAVESDPFRGEVEGFFLEEDFEEKLACRGGVEDEVGGRLCLGGGWEGGGGERGQGLG